MKSPPLFIKGVPLLLAVFLLVALLLLILVLLVLLILIILAVVLRHDGTPPFGQLGTGLILAGWRRNIQLRS